MESLKLTRPGSAKPLDANPEYMRKLFIMPDTAGRFIEFGVHLLDLIRDFFTEKGGIHSAISIEELRDIFNTIDIPEQPCRIRDVLAEIKQHVVNHSVKVSNPYFIGHMTSAIPYYMILLEMIAVALNQNQVKIETAKASSFVEREFLCWMHRMVFQQQPDFYTRTIQDHHVALGNITSDGTVANLNALAVAMTKAFPPDGSAFKGIRSAGLPAALHHYGYRRAVVLVSKRGHYSLRKAGTILGIGADNVICIPVHPVTNKVNIKELRRTIARIRREDDAAGAPTRFVALVGIAGTTETGNIDDLIALGDIARQLKAHYHVDAAWGGGALLMHEGHRLLQGIERADTVTLDAHKLLYAPNTMGICLFRDPADSHWMYHTSNYIIREGSVDQGRFTVEGSRPFAALKPWASMKIMGAEGYRVVFDHARLLQDHFVDLLSRDAQFELLNTPELFIINYRFVPRELKSRLNGLMEAPRHNSRQITRINNLLNTLNTDLHKTVREHDMSFVSRTLLESTRYTPRKVVVLRAITVNPITEPRMLSEILREHRNMGRQLWQTMLRTDPHAAELAGA